MRKFSVAAAVAASVFFTGAVSAQEFNAGAAIVGKSGEPVGAVVSVDGDTLTVKAQDGSTFGLPKAGFSLDGEVVRAAWTKAEIDQAVAQQRAAAGVKADLTNAAPGLAVRSKDGAELGIVASTVAEGGQLKTVMIKPAADGAEYGLPGAAFTLKDGALVAAWTKAEIETARGASASANVDQSPAGSSGGR